MTSSTFPHTGLIPHPQLVRYEWVSTHRACEPVKNDHTSGFIPAIITDVILLLIILAGLFIMRRDGGGVLGLTRLIWKQVRSLWRFSLAVNF
jgi:hypothetical protein